GRSAHRKLCIPTCFGNHSICGFCIQVNLSPGREREPHVVQVDDLPPIHRKPQLIAIVAAQKKAVFTLGSRLKGSRTRLIEVNRLCRGIEFRERSVIPEQPIPVGRNEKRDRNIGIGLQELHWYITQIEEPLLILPQPVKSFAGRQQKILTYSIT